MSIMTYKKRNLRGVWMKNDKIITINGQFYDRATGKPLDMKKPTNAELVHSITQKSQTLYRRAMKKPTAVVHSQLARKASVGRNMDIARSKSISHFTPHSKLAAARPQIDKQQSDIQKHVKHPLVTKAENTRMQVRMAAAKENPITDKKTSKVIKEEAIAKALDAPTEKPKKIRSFKKHLNWVNISIFVIILITTAGYFAYMNIPSLSVKVAATQAGIDATFPDYYPDGYGPSGPVYYSDNQVTIKFKSNTNESQFTIKQSKSSWDSSAVKNMVDEDSKSEFLTNEKNGLTIYSYNGNAAWVNGGILYTIAGNAPLSTDQIQRIAISL